MAESTVRTDVLHAGRPTSSDERLMAAIRAKVAIDPISGCHRWTGWRSKDGYGLVQPSGMKLQQAHRAAYMAFIGPIPAGMEIDHRCHAAAACNLKGNCPHRACVNPEHLEAVSRVANVRRSNSPSGINSRKTHCLRGHPFTPENYYAMRSGGRQCRLCVRINRRARQQQRATREEAA